MEIRRAPDIAVKQMIDSTRVYREFARVRLELKEVEGSVFWKQIGEYVYLAHKLSGKIEYKGARSKETESEFERFVTTKARLKARHKQLKESVRIAQRMNKAVHAGAVPAEIIELLNLLDEHGLYQDSLLLGAPALYAYSQSCGVEPPLGRWFDRDFRYPAGGPFALGLLINRRKTPVREISAIFGKECQARPAAAQLAVSKTSPWVFFTFQAGTSAACSVDRVDAGRNGTAFTDGSKQCLTEVWKAPASCAMSKATQALAELLDGVPHFEQVVVGKTGQMARMRTLDPIAYATVLQACTAAGAGEDAQSGQGSALFQLKFVETMVENSMIATQMDAVSQRDLDQKVHLWMEKFSDCREPNAESAQVLEELVQGREPGGALA